MSTTLRLGSTADTSGLSQTSSALTAMQQALQQATTAMSQLSTASAQMQRSLGQNTSSMHQQMKATDEATKSGNFFNDMLQSGIAKGASFAAGFLSVEAVLGVVTNAFGMLTGAIDMAITKMEKFLQDSFQLANTAQRMEYLWMYQYGGPQGGGQQISSQLAAWIPNFAMNSPYTMMQIMGAVGPLSQMGLSFHGLQRFLPLISDLAATHTSIFGGGDMLPINYAALAVMEATKGYSRRLLMELQIRPNELAQYGLKFVGDKESGQIANPEMFLPALEAYAKDKGYTGASKRMAHETISGLEASLTDRQQSFMRRLMGENIPDPNAGDLSAAVLGMIKGGDITGAMKAAGADIASLKSYGVAFGKNGLPTDMGAFQDALASFSHDKFYTDWANAGKLTEQQTKLIKSGNWKRAMQEVGADVGSLKRYGATFDANGNPIDVSAFTYALEKVSVDLHGHPQFRKGTIFDILLKGIQDFSTWWDDHQSTFDKISKFVADVGGKLLDVGRQGVSSAASGFVEGFTKTFNSGGTWQKLGNDFMSWISDPKNQQSIKDGAQWLGTNLAWAIDILATDLQKLQVAWDNLPDDWKKNGANAIGKGFELANGAVQGTLLWIGKVFDKIKDMGDWFKEHNFFDWWAKEMEKVNKMMADAAMLVILLKKALNGDVDASGILTAINNIKNDMASLFDAGSPNTQAGHNAVKNSPFNQHHKPGSGPQYGYGLGSYNQTQNNTFNIQGATSWDVQQLINQNTRALSNRQNIFSKMPGGLQYNAVGLY